MGTMIEFDRSAYRIDNENYLAVNKIGDTNLTTSDGAIVKDWNYFRFGLKSRIIKEACKWASGIEGGMFRYESGTTTPEKYIKNWRETLQNAKTFEGFKQDFRLRKGTIEYWANNKRRPSEEKIEGIKNNGWNRKSTKKKRLGGSGKKEKVVYTHPIENPEDLKEFLKQKRKLKEFTMLYMLE